MNNRKMRKGRRRCNTDEAILNTERNLAKAKKEEIPKKEKQKLIEKIEWTLERQLGLPSRRLY